MELFYHDVSTYTESVSATFFSHLSQASISINSAVYTGRVMARILLMFYPRNRDPKHTLMLQGFSVFLFSSV